MQIWVSDCFSVLALWLTGDLSRVPPTSRPMAGGMGFSPAKTWDRSIMISYSTSFAFVTVTHLSLSDRHCSTNKTACVKVMNKSHGSYKWCTCIFIRQVKPCDFLFHFFKLTSSLGCLPHALTASTVDGPVIVWPPALYLCDKHTHCWMSVNWFSFTLQTSPLWGPCSPPARLRFPSSAANWFLFVSPGPVSLSACVEVDWSVHAGIWQSGSSCDSVNYCHSACKPHEFEK